MAKLRSTDVNGNLFVSGQLKLTNPFLISTNALITNLNADLLDGYHANDLIVRSTKCYDTSSSDTADGNWTVTIPGITELTEGLTIKIRIKRAGASTCKLNLNGLGAKTVYLRYGSKLTTHYAKESVLALTYTGDAISSGTDRTGWIVENFYDTTDNYNLTVHSSKYTVKNTLYRYQICFINKDEQLIPTYHGGDNDVSTNKTLTTESFMPEKGIFFYNSTTTVQSGSYPAINTIYTNVAAIDLRFSFNTAQTLITGKPVYLVVTPQSDGQVKLASTPIVQALPTTQNSNYYIYLGQPYDNYRISLVVFHPIFKWNKKTSSFTTDSVEASDSISSLNTSVTTLNSYFTNGIAKKATADANGNVITSTYVKKAGDTMNGGLSPATNKGASLGTSSLYWNNIYGTTLYENGTSLADKYASKTNLPEAYLTWGGRNLSNSYGPIDASMVPALGANRLAFADASGIEVEYSRDNGATWTDYGLSDSKKISIFSGPLIGDENIHIGKPGEKNPSTGKYDNVSINNRLRITLRTDLAKIYTALNKFIICCSTCGSTGCKCTIEALTKRDNAAGNNSWKIVANDIDIGGFPGFNVINTASIETYGYFELQYIKIRFTFYCTGNGNMEGYGGLAINNIYGFGGVGWKTPSNMAKWGQIYTYDAYQNVTFPGNITASILNTYNIYPRVDDTYNLGSNTKKWASLYATNIHGTADYFKYGRGVMLADSTSFTNNFNKDIFGEETSDKFHLVELRTQGNAPSCLLGNHSSGIAWKGADTYGSLMVRWGYPQIRVSGGNGNNTDPKWSVDLIHSNNISSESIKYASSGLGRYDTITENSDGTYTINRQTGYILLDGVIEKNASVTPNGSTSTYRYTFDIVNGYGADGPVISNLLTNISFSDLSNNGRTGIAMYSATRCSICISGITKLEDYKSHLAKNNIYVQYKLATATTEKVEKNHYARYNERFILEHNKSEAERSANLVNTFDRSNIPSNSSLYTATLNADGSYTSKVDSDTRAWTYANSDFKFHLPKGVYTFSVTGTTISDDSNTQMEIFDSNNKLLCGVYRPNNFKNSFALTTDTDIGIMIKSYRSTDLKIMLNKGSVALPYQPYEGKVIHEKELKNNSSNYATLGYYDTVTENSDGTYTITRQTGYHNISTDLIKNGAYRTTQAGHGEYGADTGIHNLPIISGSKNFINNLLTVRDNGEVYSGSTGISITENGMCWVNLGDDYTTTKQYREYFAKNNIYVQYKLATATTEKVEKNHYARYNERYILEHNKSEAGEAVNLFDLFNIATGSGLVDPEIIFKYESGGIIIPYGTEPGSDELELQRFKNNTYVSYIGSFHEGFSSITFQKTSDFNQIRIKRNGTNKDFGAVFNVNYLEDGKTYTISAQVHNDSSNTTFYCLYIMIVEGTKAITEYYHYNPKKRITNNEALFLKTEANRSANVFDIHTVTIGNGYDYTVTATDWVKAIDIPVEPNTTYTASYPIARYAFNHGNIVADYNKNTITTGSDTRSLSLFMYVGDYSGTVNAWFSNYMLNEGSVALPYQPYEGKVIHEKDLKNASTNLGYYDTITENPDGSYTITKQTGYINGKDFLNRSVNGVGNPYVTFEHIKANKNIENIIGNCDRVGPDSWWQSTFSKVTITYDGNYDFLLILLPNGTAENDTTPLNDIHIQYKLPNTRTEKVEKNYCAQYNKRFILEHNKIEAAKSSNLWSYEQSITINAGSESWWTLSNATMVAWGLVVGETYSIKSFVNNNTKDLAFQILPGWADFRDGRTFVFTSDTQIRIGGNTVASTVTFTPKISLVKGIDISDEYQPYSGAPIHKKEFEDFKNSMKFIPYVSFVETSTSQDISENGTYFVIPTNPSNASIKLEVKAGPQGTLQTAYFSGGIISVYRNYDRKFQVCEVKIVYGAGSTAASTYILDSANYSSLPNGILSRVTGKCKIYKLI